MLAHHRARLIEYISLMGAELVRLFRKIIGGPTFPTEVDYPFIPGVGGINFNEIFARGKKEN